MDQICHRVFMRTTLDLDDELVTALLARHPGISKTEAIETAIRSYLTESAVAGLRELAGTLDIHDTSATARWIEARDGPRGQPRALNSTGCSPIDAWPCVVRSPPSYWPARRCQAHRSCGRCCDH